MMRGRNIKITLDMIKEKAKLVASSIGETELTFSNGWLQSFQKRHNINLRLLSGESADMNQQLVTNWKFLNISF